MPAVRVHIERSTSRARHAVRQVLSDLLDWEVHFIENANELVHPDFACLHYGEQAIPSALHVKPSGWLHQSGIDPIDALPVAKDGTPLIFPVEGGDLPFDPFAAAFYLLSRYEEWSPMTKDEHGRPMTGDLHAARHGYLHRPVVDEWALLLAAAWKRSDPRVPEPQRQYNQVVTVDLDNGLKYLGRPVWRTMGSMARDVLRGNWHDVRERLSVIGGRTDDPFMIDEELRERFLSATDRVMFFALAAERGEWDHAVPVAHTVYAAQLRDLSTWAQLGLHPSYFSSDRKGRTGEEMRSLEDATGSKVLATRQHFLKLRIPQTFRELEQLGVKEEHSMGLHDRLGFRCGTCTPYQWYDLEQERSTDIRIHPFTVMDNTLSEKLHLSPQEAIDNVRPLINAVKSVNGTFTGLWHESFLASTGVRTEWRKAILGIIEEAGA